MTEQRRDKPDEKQPSEAEVREKRLKAALKANMARRKGQMRARKAAQDESRGEDG